MAVSNSTRSSFPFLLVSRYSLEQEMMNSRDGQLGSTVSASGFWQTPLSDEQSSSFARAMQTKTTRKMARDGMIRIVSVLCDGMYGIHGATIAGAGSECGDEQSRAMSMCLVGSSLDVWRMERGMCSVSVVKECFDETNQRNQHETERECHQHFCHHPANDASTH
mmetsp:Transcript_15070/g.41720  ORF Transcript_15070/g.41720 Transcript_15070/m.41720 type:complete len:165 (+) Transcript_15070:297-791(+)